MPLPAHIRAPKTLEVIGQVNSILTRLGLTREEFLLELNRYLTQKRKLKEKHSGLVQVTRWLDPTSPNWSEPKGEVVIAMQEFVQNH